MPIGQHSSHIQCVSTKGKRAFIVARADNIGYTVSAIMSDVLDDWLSRGAPPVNRAEERALPLPVWNEDEWDSAVELNPELLLPKKQRSRK